MINVALVDDHDLVRQGLRALLETQSDIEVVGEATNGAEAVELVSKTQPDLILLDLQLGEENGTEVARELRRLGVRVRILILSVHDTSRDLRHALAAGIDGYLLKSVSGERLAQGIRDAVAGETVIDHEFVPKLIDEAARGGGAPPVVTDRERQVLQMVADGCSNRDVGDRLGISLRTAQKHVENLMRKFGVHDRTELVATAFRRGILG
jgi:DNA-binding NarL/FixJ family response regulator